MADDIWDDEAIKQTLEAVGLNAGVEADLPDEARFVRRIRELVTRANERHGALPSPSLYLMSAGADDAHKDPAKLHRRLHTGERDPSGRIWLMGAAAKAGHEVIADDADSEGLMRFANDALDLGHVPAVLYEPYAEILAWYPNGVNEADLVFEGPLVLTQPPSLEDLIAIVDQIHDYRLLTSFHQNADTNLWADPGKHWVHDSAERRVQDALTVGISGACADPFFVDEELKGHTGRYDIGVRERTGPGATRLHTVLELKVARSFGKTAAPTRPRKLRRTSSAESSRFIPMPASMELPARRVWCLTCASKSSKACLRKAKRRRSSSTSCSDHGRASQTPSTTAIS